MEGGSDKEGKGAVLQGHKLVSNHVEGSGRTDKVIKHILMSDRNLESKSSKRLQMAELKKTKIEDSLMLNSPHFLDRLRDNSRLNMMKSRLNQLQF